MASIIFTRPAKSTTMKFWMLRPVRLFTAFSVQLAAEARSPPVWYAPAKIELNITPYCAGMVPLEVSHCGTSTKESRGMDTRLMAERSAEICSTMAVSA